MSIAMKHPHVPRAISDAIAEHRARDAEYDRYDVHAALVSGMTQRNGSQEAHIITGDGHHHFLVKNAEVVRTLARALAVTDRGFIPVDLTILDGRYIVRARETPPLPAEVSEYFSNLYRDPPK